MLEDAGKWGNWYPTDKEKCPPGWLINGFKVRFEPQQGSGDDTALNGLQIQCKNPNNPSETQQITVYEGLWGNWGDWLISDNYYLCGIQTRFEDCP